MCTPSEIFGFVVFGETEPRFQRPERRITRKPPTPSSSTKKGETMLFYSREMRTYKRKQERK